jgi:hypothetical protein
MSGCGQIEVANAARDANIDEPEEPHPMISPRTRQRAIVLVVPAIAAMAVAAAAGAATAGGTGPAAPSPGAAPAKALPWLDVSLPAAPGAGVATGKLVLRLSPGDKRVPADYAGAKVSIGGEPPRVVAAGDRLELAIAASARAPFRLEIGGVRVLAHVHPGDTLSIDEGHDGGWTAVIGSRMNENAPKRLTVCRPRTSSAGECPAGYASTRVFEGDAVCPAPRGDDPVYKCVKAPVVRARGPVTGRAEVTRASADGRLDEPDTVSLAPGPLAAKTVGPAIPIAIGPEAMPTIRIGHAAALLVVGPGGSYEVWLDAQGRVDSAELAPK